MRPLLQGGAGWILTLAAACWSGADEPAPAAPPAATPPVVAATLTVERLPKDDAVALGYPIELRLVDATGEALPGCEITLRLRVELRDGYHIYGPKEEGYAPTVFRAPDGAPYAIAGIAWPPLERYRTEWEDVAAYEDGTVIPITLRLADDIAPGEHDLAIDLGFSACNDDGCLAPQEWRLLVRVAVALPPG